MKKLLTIIFVLSSLQVMSQVPINMGTNETNSFFLRTFEVQEQDADHAENPNIKGSRYYRDEFIEGEVFVSNANLTNVRMRYDIFYDAFQFQIKGKARRLDPKLAIERIVMGDETFVIKVFNYKGKDSQGFLQVLVGGKYSLLAKKNISLRPERPPRALETEPSPPEYLKMNDTYYVEMLDGELIEVSSGKDLAKKLGNDNFTYEAKKQKISLKGDKKLVELVELMNEVDL